MSAVTEVRTGGWKQQYDKILLVVLLIGLLVSAAILWLKIEQSQHLLAVSGEAVTPTEDQMVTPLDGAELLARIERLLEPFQVPTRARRMFVSEVRTACLKCGKPVPILEMKCPFCGFEEEGDDPTKRDSDGDGMPDWWEEKYGLNLYNPEDGGLDPDGDMFSNYEEFLAGTDPRDSASCPDLPVKLRMVGAPRREPLEIRFLALQEIVEGQQTFQVNIRDRTYFAKIGDRVSGFEIVAYNPTDDSLVVRQGERKRTLKRGEIASDEDYVVKFILLTDRSTYDVKVGTEFKLRDERYRFEEITDDGRARVVAVESGKEYLVPMADPRELEVGVPESSLIPEGFSPGMLPSGAPGFPPPHR